MDMDHMNGICKSCDELFTVFHKHALAYEEEQKMLRETRGDGYVKPPLGYFNLYSALADMALEMIFLRKFFMDHVFEEEDKKIKTEKKYQDVLDSYEKSNLISSGTPDQFQYRQNQLIQNLAEYIIERDSQTEDKKKKDE